MKHENVIGKIFGNWLVLEKLDKRKDGRIHYKCQCQCINKTIQEIYGSELVNGLMNMCRFCRRRSVSKKLWKGRGEISGHQWNAIVNGARHRNKELEFDITIEYIWDLFLKQNRKCAISGMSLNFKELYADFVKGNFKKITASLDRIDSDKGYVKGNVQWVHKHIQKMKWDHDQNYFIELCSIVAKHNAKFGSR